MLLEPDWIRKQRFFRFSFPLHVKGVFSYPKRRYSKWSPVRSFLKTPAYSYHKSYSACPKRDDFVFPFAFSCRRAKTIQMGYVWTFTSLICCLVPKFFVLESKNRFINRYNSHVGNNFVNAACVISKTALKLIV